MQTEMPYTLLFLWALPFGLVLLIRVVPAQLRGLRRARRLHERLYWGLNAAGYLIVAYGTLSTGAMMVDDCLGRPWALAAHWLSPSRWLGLGNDTVVLLLLDLVLLLGAGLLLVCVARYFGYTDESDVWCRPEWLNSVPSPPETRHDAGWRG